MVRDRGDRHTHDLLSWEPPQVAIGYSEEVAGKGELQNQIARLVSRALRDARDNGDSRAAIASIMSNDLGRTISEDMLDKYASEAAEAHRIPLDAFIALIRATGAVNLLGFIPGMFGFAVVDEKYQPIIELHLLDEHQRELDAYRARTMANARSRR